MSTDKGLVVTLRIEQVILTIRRQRVILDSDLAAVYGVTTKTLNQAISRNAKRFPPDFVFRLTAEEMKALRPRTVTSSGAGNRSSMVAADTPDANQSQFVTSSQKHRSPRFRPYAFIEHGALMVANVLRSPRAVEMRVFVMRAFVRLRQWLVGHAELSRRSDELERKSDAQFKVVFDTIRQLMAPPVKERRSVGFRVEGAGRCIGSGGPARPGDRPVCSEHASPILID